MSNENRQNPCDCTCDCDDCGGAWQHTRLEGEAEASPGLSYVIYHTDTNIGDLPATPDMDVLTPGGTEHGNVIDIFRDGGLIARLDAGMTCLQIFDGGESYLPELPVRYAEVGNIWHHSVQSTPTIEEDAGKYVLSVDSKTADDAMISHYTITIHPDGSIYFNKNTVVPNPLSADEYSSEDGLVGIVLVAGGTAGDGAHVNMFVLGKIRTYFKENC